MNWGYGNYVTIGLAPSPSRAFLTVNRLDGNMNPTAEEFHYQFDLAGRLRQAAFAQTPQTGQNGYQNAPAASRARAWYDYNAQGQLVTLNHWWDTLVGGVANIPAGTKQIILALEDYGPGQVWLDDAAARFVDRAPAK